MEVLNYLFAALGRLLLWVSSILVIEELTLGGLARLLLSAAQLPPAEAPQIWWRRHYPRRRYHRQARRPRY